MRRILLTFSLLFALNIFAESPRTGMMELQFGFFTPDIDSEEALTTKPYEDIFGENGFVWRFEYGINIWSGFGTFAISFATGNFSVDGKGVYTDDNTKKSEDETILHIVPNILFPINYSFDTHPFPIVPYVKLGVAYYIWWITDGVGDVASANGNDAIGGKWGWEAIFGFRFLLDFIDPSAAFEFDNEMGINDSYIFAEYRYTKIDDFGGEGLSLGSAYWNFGLALAF
ncbi:hypothetical protein JXR93_04415 [bacterium]|nr:hypothetical protein [bacterium]